jgi:hypothetical protein
MCLGSGRNTTTATTATTTPFTSLTTTPSRSPSFKTRGRLFFLLRGHRRDHARRRCCRRVRVESPRPRPGAEPTVLSSLPSATGVGVVCACRGLHAHVGRGARRGQRRAAIGVGGGAFDDDLRPARLALTYCSGSVGSSSRCLKLILVINTVSSVRCRVDSYRNIGDVGEFGSIAYRRRRANRAPPRSTDGVAFAWSRVSAASGKSDRATRKDGRNDSKRYQHQRREVRRSISTIVRKRRAAVVVRNGGAATGAVNSPFHDKDRRADRRDFCRLRVTAEFSEGKEG